MSVHHAYTRFMEQELEARSAVIKHRMEYEALRRVERLERELERERGRAHVDTPAPRAA